MAERSRPPLPSAVQPPPPPGAPRRGTAAAAATNGTGAASTSRNLFKGHFTRRPTTAAAGNGAGVGAMASATGAAGGGGGGVAAGSAMSRSRTGSTTTTSSGSANSAETVRLPLSESVVGIDHGAIISEPLEIVVRDKHGEIEMGELPMLVLDDADEGFMHDQEETKSACFTSLFISTSPIFAFLFPFRSSRSDFCHERRLHFGSVWT